MADPNSGQMAIDQIASIVFLWIATCVRIFFTLGHRDDRFHNFIRMYTQPLRPCQVAAHGEEWIKCCAPRD